jgi:hypothetical protein
MTMAYRRFISLAAAIFVAFAVAPARATSNYEYAKGEYAPIQSGFAPNKHLSLASHGTGELGDDDFHVWLMSEPAHRRIMALPDIGADNNLDTAPDAYHAFWSEDARYVAVAFRTDRHEIGLNLYSIEGGKARLIGVPRMFKEVTSRDVVDRDGRHELVSRIEWRRGGRFLLKEYQTFVVSDPAFLRQLGAYGRVKEKLDDGKLYVEFAAEADCILEGNHHYRVIDLKPGNADQPPDW